MIFHSNIAAKQSIYVEFVVGSFKGCDAVAFQEMFARRGVGDVNAEVLSGSVSDYLAVVGNVANGGVNDPCSLDDLLQDSKDIDSFRFLGKVDIKIVIGVRKALGWVEHLPIVDLTLTAAGFAPSRVRDRFHSVKIDSKENQIKGHMANVVLLIVVKASVLIVHGLDLQENHYNAHQRQTHLQFIINTSMGNHLLTFCVSRPHIT